MIIKAEDYDYPFNKDLRLIRLLSPVILPGSINTPAA